MESKGKEEKEGGDTEEAKDTPSSRNKGNGKHSFEVLGTRFDVDLRYTILDPVGQGAYGIVCAAKDEVESCLVAVKRIDKVFEHDTFTKRTLREIRLLRLLQHENLIGLRTILQPADSSSFQDLYVIFELMETDLASIIKSPQPLTDEHSQFFLYQILRGLKFIHSANVIHRDLKPRNVLVNSNCDLKICDFGLARVDFPQSNRKVTAMTDYVATRWYRAPEVIMPYQKYTKAIDMWAVGCILAELIGRKPIFPGSNFEHQTRLIFETLGTPSPEFVANVKHGKALAFMKRLPKFKPKNLANMYPGANIDAVEMLQKLLELEPSKRDDIDQAIARPYLEALHYPDDEPVTKPLSRIHFDFERRSLPKGKLRSLILEEVAVYNGGNGVAPAGGGLDDLSEMASAVGEVARKK